MKDCSSTSRYMGNIIITFNSSAMYLQYNIYDLSIMSLSKLIIKVKYIIVSSCWERTIVSLYNKSSSAQLYALKISWVRRNTLATTPRIDSTGGIKFVLKCTYRTMFWWLTCPPAFNTKILQLTTNFIPACNCQASIKYAMVWQVDPYHYKICTF